jgi:hypothetical protein
MMTNTPNEELDLLRGNNFPNPSPRITVMH